MNVIVGAIDGQILFSQGTRIFSLKNQYTFLLFLGCSISNIIAFHSLYSIFVKSFRRGRGFHIERKRLAELFDLLLYRLQFFFMVYTVDSFMDPRKQCISSLWNPCLLWLKLVFQFLYHLSQKEIFFH